MILYIHYMFTINDKCIRIYIYTYIHTHAYSVIMCAVLLSKKQLQALGGFLASHRVVQLTWETARWFQAIQTGLGGFHHMRLRGSSGQKSSTKYPQIWLKRVETHVRNHRTTTTKRSMFDLITSKPFFEAPQQNRMPPALWN